MRYSIHADSVSTDLLAKRIHAVSRSFRQRYPLENAPWRTGHYLIPICSFGRPAHKVLIWYHNQGCSWARKAGCTMCNFGERDDVPLDQRVIDDFDEELSKLDPGTRFIHLGPGGSVMQENELASRMRVRLFAALDRLPFLEGVGLETRAETIRADRISEILEVLPMRVSELALGFGLESSDEFILRTCVSKGERIADIERALNVITREFPQRGRRKVVADCYVLLKPPFMTEAEAIEDAIRSITWAYDRGVDTVTLFVNTIKKNTLCWWLSEASSINDHLRYRTPYLLSAIAVLAGLPPEYRARTNILGFTSGNPYLGAPRACDLCWHVLHGLISSHNYGRDPAILTCAQEIRCQCWSDWNAELSAAVPGSLFTRVTEATAMLERTFARSNDPA
jgi:radical SAM enzyme (TIGR01210 family)